MNKKNSIRLIVILGIIVIPLMYSYFYLKAFWDPYSKLEDIPIAIVNLDKSVDNENKGKDLVSKLKKEKVLKIEEKDKVSANEGLTNKKYYAVITIPEDFTKNLSNVETKNRKISTITYSPNQKTNYLASQIISRVVLEVETELHKEITQNIVAGLTDKLNDVPTQVEKINDGVNSISNGSNSLLDGINKISNGTNLLSTNYNVFNTGIQTLKEGITKLDTSTTILNNSTKQIYEGSMILKDKTKDLDKLSRSIKTLSEGNNTLNENLNLYMDSINTLYTKVNYLSNLDPGNDELNELNNTLKTLTENGQKLKNSSNYLNQNFTDLNNSTKDLGEVYNGIETLTLSLEKLSNGTEELNLGVKDLNKGSNELSTNSEIINSSLKDLNKGVKEASIGNEKLVNGINTAKDEINSNLSDTKTKLKELDGLDKYASEPIKVNEKDINKVNAYGTGFAPYFMSLSLWVGGLVIFMGIYYDSRFKILGKNSENKFLRTGIYILIGILQAIILGYFLKIGLGFNVTNNFRYYMSCILTSIVFITIIQFLFINFNDIGKFLAIFLLILQLAASGGTFPIETVPSFFQKIYPLMPMKYSIGLFKESLVSFDKGFVFNNSIVLIGLLLVFLTLTIIFDIIKKEKKA